MDVFGLGSLVDKIGERFGNRVRDALLFFVAIAAFVVCINAIVTYGILPVVAFIQSIGTKSAISLVQSLLTGVVVGGAAGVVFQFVVRLLLKRLLRRAEEQSDEAGRLIERVRDLLGRTTAGVAEAKAMLEETRERAAELDAREKQLQETERKRKRSP